MTNETRNRIRAYMEELPFMKEKIFGALLMLVIAAGVIVASTYAWVTLSRSPEITEITTTLAANGALEIALSNPEGTVPDEFDIDESITQDTNVTVSNLQWGNLVNLSDASYGIDNMALRPAQLNTTSLLTSPLWGAAYGEDGRITNLDSNYAYAKYNGSQFLTTNEYGVRAIATYEATISDATQQAYNEKVKAVVTAHTNVNQVYSNVAPKFSALGTMISKYAQNKLDDGYTDLAPYLTDMIPLYDAVRDAMDAQKEAYVALANLQYYLYSNELGLPYAPLSWDELVAKKSQYNTASADKESSGGVISLVGLTQFITDYNNLLKDIEYLNQYLVDYQTNRSPYYWGGYRMDGETKVPDNSVSGYTLSNIVSHLIDYGSMTIDLDNNGTETKVTGLGMSNASSLLGANGKQRSVYIYNGILYRLEKSSVDEGYRINGNAACTINVRYVMSITVYGNAYTKASGACTFMENYTATLGTELVPKDAVAKDTYGLAIDMWVRTNAEETCLTLEGATSTDVQGNIVSYDGVNRVWGATGEAVLTTDSTTQGGGSCYIYYADTPEDMARSLDLLNAMKVAFVDSAGNLLATGEMDTVNYWAVNGRITVPLVLNNQSPTTYIYIDSKNQEQVGRAITTLYIDRPVRVTAIVYLDGTLLTNDHVLSSAEIQGSLNIQFGSSVNLETVGSNELIDDIRTVTATVNPAKLDYDTARVDADMTTSVTVNVEGVDPSKVTAFFVRAINSTQGTREKTMTFAKQSNGTWICDYKFDAPGIYYLRQVRLDGVDYTLADPQKVEVSGFGLSSVTWSESADVVAIQTSADSHSTTVSIRFASNDRSKLPASVQVRFVRDDGNTVNIPLTYNANGSWVGTGTFTASGVYQLQYLVANGDRYIDLALNNGSYRTLDLSLGMYVSVTDLSGGLQEDYDPDEVEANDKVYNKNVAVYVYNNADIKLEGLENLVLYYSNGTSLANTISTNLTWDDLEHCYLGTLPIINPGRYQFAFVTVGGNMLSKCSESPTYTVISPNPPVYDEESACKLNDVNGIQFVPMTNDAKIDGIVIENAESALASAVVYSAVSQSFYDVAMHFDGSAWYMRLPTYNGETQIGEDTNGNPIYEQLQDGVWNLAAIRLWNCYDGVSVDLREESNPVLWVDSTLGQDYLASLDEGVTADKTIDFSKLSTDVSGSLSVRLDAKDKILGGNDAEFLSVFHTEGLGLRVIVEDDNHNAIPDTKIKNMKLTVSYDVNTAAANGYPLQGNTITKEYELPMEYDKDFGCYIISNTAPDWRYVGEYTVTKLSFNIVGIEEPREYVAKDGIGIPVKYTVKTQGPNTDNILMLTTQNVEVLGKYGSDVTGTFLESHSLEKIRAEFKLDLNGDGKIDESDSSVVDISSLVTDVKLVLKYGNGTTAPNGGYTWTGTSEYQDIEIPMTNIGGSYVAGSTPLLAGTYSAKITAKVNNNPVEQALKNITAHSKLPDVTMALATGTPTNPTVNADAGVEVSANTFTGTNRIMDNGYSVLLYPSYQSFTADNNTGTYDNYTSTDYSTTFADYTMPALIFTLSGAGDVCKNFTLSIPGNSTSAAFTGNGSSEAVTIGSITEGTAKRKGTYSDFWSGTTEVDFTYKTERPNVLGERTITSITATMGAGTYHMELANSLQIVERNTTPPSLIFVATDGFTTPAERTSTDGASFEYTLPTIAQYGSVSGVYIPEPVIVTNTGDSEVTKDLPAISDSLSWLTTNISASPTAKLYTQSYADNESSHRVLTKRSYYWRTGTQYLYDRYTLSQKATADRELNGTTVVTTTTKTYDRLTTLDYWLVNGVRYAPGATIAVDGNWIAEPVLKAKDTLTQTVVVTETTEGITIESYEATCSAVQVVKQAEPITETSPTYCGHSGLGGACSYVTQGDNASAKAARDAWSQTAPTGYTYVSTAPTEGITRSLNGVTWKITGTASAGGTTTTVTQIYDGNGNLINTTNS